MNPLYLRSMVFAFMEAKCLLQSPILQPCVDLPKCSWEHRTAWEGEKLKEELQVWWVL